MAFMVLVVTWTFIQVQLDQVKKKKLYFLIMSKKWIKIMKKNISKSLVFHFNLTILSMWKTNPCIIDLNCNESIAWRNCVHMCQCHGQRRKLKETAMEVNLTNFTIEMVPLTRLPSTNTNCIVNIQHTSLSLYQVLLFLTRTHTHTHRHTQAYTHIHTKPIALIQLRLNKKEPSFK